MKQHLKGDGQENELVIRVGADRESLPTDVPSGWDFEKYLYIPGIYDSVELILTGEPYIDNVQTVPDVDAARRCAWWPRLQAAGEAVRRRVDVRGRARPRAAESSARLTARRCPLAPASRRKIERDDPDPGLPALVAGGPVPLRAAS